MNRIDQDLFTRSPIDRWVVEPARAFIHNSTTGGILLFVSALLALIIANSPFSDAYFHFWEIQVSVGWGDAVMSKTLHHWINDGLMAVFFFVVGLELKREIIGGELSTMRKAMLPMAAAIGGMVVPAIIYLYWNSELPASKGWGIPMATDIAFALGVVYLLGDRVPVPLKIFLTALAITDDLGAVLVIAFFYTSEIHFTSLATGAGFLAVLLVANRIGVRSTLFYALVGIGGLWMAFLMSGVHATIAAVLAAFAIPADVKVTEVQFTQRMALLVEQFRNAEPNEVSTVTPEQLHILQEIRGLSKQALTPLQRLEQALHPWVSFVIMPIFAFSNAGISLSGDILQAMVSPITIGVFAGLIAGKVIGVTGTVYLCNKMKWTVLPYAVTPRHVIGIGFLAAIGFTMSLFVAGLAFSDPLMLLEAKLGIFAASLTASCIGFLILRKTGSPKI